MYARPIIDTIVLLTPMTNFLLSWGINKAKHKISNTSSSMTKKLSKAQQKHTNPKIKSSTLQASQQPIVKAVESHLR